MTEPLLKKKTVVETAVVRGIVVICQLVFLKLYTHYISLYELGIYYFLFTISTSVNAFLLVPLDYFQQSRLYKLKADGFSITSLFTINRVVLQAAFIILIVSLGISYFLKPSFCLALLVLIPLAVSTYLVNLLRGIVNNLENRRFSVYSLLFETVLKISLFAVLVNFFHASALLLLTATLLASISVCIAIFLYLRTLAEYKLPQKTMFELKEIVLFTYPISIGAIINWIQLQSYTIILVSLGFVEIVGVFGTITNIGSSGMNACSTMFSQLFVPNLYKTHGRYIGVYLRNALLIILGVAIFSALASDIIVGLLTKRELLGYSKIIIYGILTEAGNFIIGALTIYLTIQNLTKTTVKMSSLGLIVFFASFGVLYMFKHINVYTLGIPMVLTQLVIGLGLYTIVHKQKKLHE